MAALAEEGHLRQLFLQAIRLLVEPEAGDIVGFLMFPGFESLSKALVE